MNTWLCEDEYGAGLDAPIIADVQNTIKVQTMKQITKKQNFIPEDDYSYYEDLWNEEEKSQWENREMFGIEW